MTAGQVYTDEDWGVGLSSGNDLMSAALRERLRSGLHAALASRSDVIVNDLDDFIQDAMIRILDRLVGYRGDSSFLTWAMTVAIRVAMTALRRRRWKNASDELRKAAQHLEICPECREEFAALLRAEGLDPDETRSRERGQS